MPSQYSPGLGQWDLNSPWSSNIINQGVRNTQSFLQADPSMFYGQETGYLTNQLKGIIEGGLDPALMQLLGVGRQNISREGDTARRNINQSLASSGFRGSGANLMNDVFGTQSNAFGNLNASIGQLGMQNRQNAIEQLLGLNQLQTGVNVNLASQQANAAQGLYGLGESRNRSDFAAGQQPSEVGQIFGSIASALPYAAIALSDKKVKEYIKYTDEKTKDGIPIVEFNYKGNDQRFRGVIAQDVEKIRPDAVIEIQGLKHVNYGVL